MTARRLGQALAFTLIVLAAGAAPAYAYLQLAVSVPGRGVRSLRWMNMPVRWFAQDRGTAGVTPSQFQTTMARAFATWEEVPSASVEFEFVGFTSASPFDDDGVSVLGFQAAPELERVLGATGFTVDMLTGEIIESDIFFNEAFSWSVAEGSDPARFDLLSVAVHEIGHFAGLGHSAIGETELLPSGGRRVIASGAVMFPISLGRGSIQDRTLQPDDIAGISVLYPERRFSSETGTISGRVARSGSGLIGAHVVAFNPDTRAIVGGFSLSSEGAFEIGGLAPGAYVVRVEPLDDADIESFFTATTAVDVAFAVTFQPGVVVAPRGGSGERVTIEVRPK